MEHNVFAIYLNDHKTYLHDDRLMKSKLANNNSQNRNLRHNEII